MTETQTAYRTDAIRPLHVDGRKLRERKLTSDFTVITDGDTASDVRWHRMVRDRQTGQIVMETASVWPDDWFARRIIQSLFAKLRRVERERDQLRLREMTWVRQLEAANLRIDQLKGDRHD